LDCGDTDIPGLLLLLLFLFNEVITTLLVNELSVHQCIMLVQFQKNLVKVGFNPVGQ